MITLHRTSSPPWTRRVLLYFVPHIFKVHFAPLSTMNFVILLNFIGKWPKILLESGLHAFIENMSYGLSLCVYISIIPCPWNFRFVLWMLKPLNAALKTRFLFNISSNFCLRYYEIFISLFASSLNLKENPADTLDTIGM